MPTVTTTTTRTTWSDSWSSFCGVNTNDMQHDIKFNEVETCEVHTLSNNVYKCACACVGYGKVMRYICYMSHYSHTQHEHNKLAYASVDGVHRGRILFCRFTVCLSLSHSRSIVVCVFLCVNMCVCLQASQSTYISSFICMMHNIDIDAKNDSERERGKQPTQTHSGQRHIQASGPCTFNLLVKP